MLRGGEPERMLLDLGDTSPQIREESCPRSRSADADTNWRDGHRVSGGWGMTRYN